MKIPVLVLTGLLGAVTALPQGLECVDQAVHKQES